MLFADIIGNEPIKKALLYEANEGRVSHAQLFFGAEGSAKLPLAIAFANYLLCDEPTKKDACGQCESCQKVLSLVHPDLHFVFPIVLDSKAKIASSDDRMREWISFVQKNKYFDLSTWQEYLEELDRKSVV